MINPNPLYSIGPADPRDVPEMNRIEQEAFSTPWTRELLRAAISNSQYQVRVLRTADADVLGFYIAHSVKHRCNLDNLAVDSWARGKGYGSELILDWMGGARAEGKDLLTLQVNTANKRAQKLYHHFDFETSRLLVAYYPNGDDAYQMQLRMNPPRLEEIQPSGKVIQFREKVRRGSFTRR
jgi:ribosomal-protein-alanine N-acetyltransferase